MRVRMTVSIAGANFSFQPNEIVDLPDDSQTRAWLANGHAQKVPKGTPLTDRELDSHDLTAEEALARACAHCNR